MNYKILTHILATPVIIAAAWDKGTLQWYTWCGARASISHILIDCPETVALHNFIESKSVILLQDMKAYWIFGLKSNSLNPIIWITNFVIYKAHLIATDSKGADFQDLFLQECNRFWPMFSILYHWKYWPFLLYFFRNVHNITITLGCNVKDTTGRGSRLVQEISTWTQTVHIITYDWSIVPCFWGWRGSSLSWSQMSFTQITHRSSCSGGWMVTSNWNNTTTISHQSC